MTRYSKNAHGKYVVGGHTYESLIGSRAQVWHGTSYKTSGGLTKRDLLQNKAGRIVSKTKCLTAKKEKRLVKAGYGTKKGHFGYVKIGSKRGGTHHNNHYGHSHASHHNQHHMKHHKGGKGTRKQRGGMQALNPANYNGEGVGTSGVGIQFVAGSATS
jgi:hypothetical protein